METITAELKGHFLRLYHMALTDGDFHPEEWKMLYRFAEDRGIPRSQLDHLLLNHTGSIDIPKEVDDRIEYLYDLATMIWADEIVSDDERNTLIKYVKKFNFLDENSSELADFLLDCAKSGRNKTEVISLLKNQ